LASSQVARQGDPVSPVSPAPGFVLHVVLTSAATVVPDGPALWPDIARLTLLIVTEWREFRTPGFDQPWLNPSG